MIKLSKMDQFIYDTKIAKCNECTSINNCTQDAIGVKPYVYVKNGVEKLIAELCDKIPTKIYGSYEKTIREQNCSILSTYQRSIANELYKLKNGYLCGEAGHGKTTILKCLVKKYSERRITTCFELAINITNNIKDFDNKEVTIESYQQMPMLFIDDFARELLTAWTISQVWIPIIQYRVDNGLPTFISSNYTIKQLHKLIAELRDITTADMLMDRIKKHMPIKEIKEKNYRL